MQALSVARELFLHSVDFVVMYHSARHIHFKRACSLQPLRWMRVEKRVTTPENHLYFIKDGKVVLVCFFPVTVWHAT